MKVFVIIVMCASTLHLKAQNMVGDWELYDTLSISQVKLGNNMLNKVKLIHKQLTINQDGTFSIKHIEPKGFSINADIDGTWESNDNEIILLYENIHENQKGEKVKKPVKEKLTIIDETKMSIDVEPNLFFIYHKN